MKRSVQVKQILGTCPFVVDTTNKCFRLSNTTTAFAIVYIFLILGVYAYPAYNAVVLLSSMDNSTMRTVALAITNILNPSFFAAIMLLAVLNRQHHVDLLNTLAHIHDRMNVEPNTAVNFRRLNLLNCIFVGTYFCCPLSNKVFSTGIVVRSPTVISFYILYGFVLASELVAIVHIQDIVIVFTNLYDRCRSDDRVDDFSNLSDLVDLFDVCFGGQIGLSHVKDIAILVNIMFFIIRRYIYKVDEMNSADLVYFAFFCLPTIVKNVWLTWIVGRLQSVV